MTADAAPEGHNTPRLTKTRFAHRWLRERIETGEFKPGHRLVIADISRALGVSNGPVREALHMLHAQGLVEFSANASARVAAHDENLALDRRQLLSIILGAAESIAASHMRPRRIATLQRLNDALRIAIGRGDASLCVDVDIEFHRRLISECPNASLRTLALRQMQSHARGPHGLFRDPKDLAIAQVEHERLLAAIAAGAEPPELEDQLRRHHAF